MSVVHPQWQSVTKNFHLESHNGRANLKTPLPTQFCDVWLSFVEQWLLSLEYPKASIMLTLFLDTETAVSSFLLVIDQLFRLSSTAHWSSIWVTAAVGWLELHSSLRFAWPFSEPIVYEAQWLTVLLLTALTFYTFLICWWLLLTESFSATRNSVTSLCLKCTSPYHAILMTPSTCAKECIFPWHCSNKCTFIINHRKNCRNFLLILNEVQKGLKNFLGSPHTRHKYKFF